MSFGSGLRRSSSTSSTTTTTDGLGQEFCEAVYTDQLVIEAGATLNTNGCPVYYVSLQLDGSVDDAGNLIQLPPACPHDLDCSGRVGTADLLTLLSAWGSNPGHPADFDGNGSVGTSDLLKLLSNWGPCPGK